MAFAHTREHLRVAIWNCAHRCDNNVCVFFLNIYILENLNTLAKILKIHLEWNVIYDRSWCANVLSQIVCYIFESDHFARLLMDIWLGGSFQRQSCASNDWRTDKRNRRPAKSMVEIRLNGRCWCDSMWRHCAFSDLTVVVFFWTENSVSEGEFSRSGEMKSEHSAVWRRLYGTLVELRGSW